jgi:virginiamycin B lyase
MFEQTPPFANQLGAPGGRTEERAAKGRIVSARRRLMLFVGVAVAAACGSVAGAADAAIYWANASGNTIGEANLDGTGVNQSFITGADGPSDVVVYGQHIYWANATGGCTEFGSCAGTIGEANLDGTDVEENFIPADTPYGLAVNGQYIYWSNFGTNTVGRANLDGSDVDQNFITGAHGPDGVVVDSQYIYWSNSGSNTIGEANLDGTAVNQSFITGAPSSGPEGMAIDSQYIYWTNSGVGTIGRASLDGTAVNERFITDVGNFPTRVAVDSQHIYWTTWTVEAVPSTGTIGEANLDGTDVNNNFIYSANSPVGVAVTAGTISTGATTECRGPNANKIGISGPTQNVYHRHFSETVTGTACGGANYLISGEQLYPAGGCASTYVKESRKADWYQWPTGTGAVNARFERVARFYARNHNRHGICSYLINRGTRGTYAHASRWWNNS